MSKDDSESRTLSSTDNNEYSDAFLKPGGSSFQSAEAALKECSSSTRHNKIANQRKGKKKQHGKTKHNHHSRGGAKSSPRRHHHHTHYSQHVVSPYYNKHAKVAPHKGQRPRMDDATPSAATAAARRDKILPADKTNPVSEQHGLHPNHHVAIGTHPSYLSSLYRLDNDSSLIKNGRGSSSMAHADEYPCDHSDYAPSDASTAVHCNGACCLSNCAAADFDDSSTVITESSNHQGGMVQDQDQESLNQHEREKSPSSCLPSTVHVVIADDRTLGGVDNKTIKHSLPHSVSDCHKDTGVLPGSNTVLHSTDVIEISSAQATEPDVERSHSDINAQDMDSADPLSSHWWSKHRNHLLAMVIFFLLIAVAIAVGGSMLLVGHSDTSNVGEDTDSPDAVIVPPEAAEVPTLPP